MKKIKLSTIGQYYTYKDESLLPLLISSLGYDIVWVDPDQCDVLIIGKPMNALKWILKKGTSVLLPDHCHTFINKYINSRHYKPLTLFHTCENLRHDSVKTDYSISFDFSSETNKHFRLPYWMEMVDWSHEGLQGNKNKRFGKLFSISRMMQPLGRKFLSKPRKAVIFASHLNGPRKHIFFAIKKVIATDGFGKYFDKKITNHTNSGFEKLHILNDYAFNLCPENKLYPGYYTEKIPEAFLGESLPLTWTDSNVSADFNPKAFLNLEQIDWRNFDVLHEFLHSEKQLTAYVEQPLLLTAPSIEPFREFIRNLLGNAI
ncbi:MAG: hypothetical protein HKK66_11095 [Chlorobiaceae bacterium]|nr:hypothetical protein [Chlorobiaceae bacterium]